MQSGSPQKLTQNKHLQKHKPRVHTTRSSSASLKHGFTDKQMKTNSISSATSHSSVLSKGSSGKISPSPIEHGLTAKDIRNADGLLRDKIFLKRTYSDLTINNPWSSAETSKTNSDQFGGFNLRQVAFSSLVLAIICGILVGVLLYFYKDSRTLYSNDYTLCSKIDSNTTCQSIVDGQMSVNNPIEQSCTCRLSFELEEIRDVQQINVYYGLSKFYQNYRFLAHSVDAYQVSGKSLEPRNHKVCRPMVNNKTSVPCGGLANVLFDDEFNLYHGNTTFSMDRYNIALERSRKYQYGNPSDLSGLRDHSKPSRWTYDILNLDRDSLNNGFENGPLIVWLTSSMFGDFVKLYSIIKPPNRRISKGQYYLEIHYRYGVFLAGGSKLVHLETVGAQGLRNSRLLITLSIMTVIYLTIFILTFLVWWRWAYRGQDLFLLL